MKKIKYIIINLNTNFSSYYTDKDIDIFTSNIKNARFYEDRGDAIYDSYLINRVSNYKTSVIKITEEDLKNL